MKYLIIIIGVFMASCFSKPEIKQAKFLINKENNTIRPINMKEIGESRFYFNVDSLVNASFNIRLLKGDEYDTLVYEGIY